jgi:hypothetical protein
MPSVIRSACRSHIAFDEDDILLYMADLARGQLEVSPLKYPFVQEHITILIKFNPQNIRSFIRARRHYGKQSLMPFCRYEIEGHKRSCWHCPHVKEIIDYLKGGKSCQNAEVERDQ